MLTAAMRDEVEHEAIPAGIVEGIDARRARRRREAFTVVGVAASVLTLVGVGALAVGGSKPAPSRPAASSTASPTATAEPTAPAVPHSRVEATSIPSGFRKWNSRGEPLRFPDD